MIQNRCIFTIKKRYLEGLPRYLGIFLRYLGRIFEYLRNDTKAILLGLMFVERPSDATGSLPAVISGGKMVYFVFAIFLTYQHIFGKVSSNLKRLSKICGVNG